MQLTKDKGAAGAANDENGLIQFIGDNANQDQVIFSEIKSQVKDPSTGNETGMISFIVANDGNEEADRTTGLKIEGNAGTHVDVTLGNHRESKITIAGEIEANGDTHTFTSANATDPLITIKILQMIRMVLDYDS